MNLEIGLGQDGEFFIEDGILRRRVRKKDTSCNAIKKHIEYNEKVDVTYIVQSKINPYHLIRGPIFVDKLWVIWKGNHMLLPVYVVEHDKLLASRIGHSYRLTTKQLSHLKEMEPVELEGSSCFITLYDTKYDFIVYKKSIEDYKKEKL